MEIIILSIIAGILFVKLMLDVLGEEDSVLLIVSVPMMFGIVAVMSVVIYGFAVTIYKIADFFSFNL